VPTSVPPQLPEYHFHDAPVPNVPPTTLSVEEPPGHTLVGDAVAEVGAVEIEPDVSAK